MSHVQLEQGAVVGGYCAFRDEMDPAPLIRVLQAAGHKIALPVITGKASALSFRLYEPGDTLIANSMGIKEPASEAALAAPDVLLVPLLAFDRWRQRLGYGGGYYDRTIAELRARKPVLAIGIAYSWQEVAAIPTGPHDIGLDRVVTELNVF